MQNRLLSVTGLLCATLVFALPHPTRAQSPSFPHTVELWGGGGWWSGEEAESYGAGGATGATALFSVGWPVQLGFDLGFSRFATDVTIGDQSSFDVDEFSASGMLRRRVGSFSRFYPFLGARVGYTRTSATVETIRLEQNGVLLGPSLGVETLLSGRIMLAVTGDVLYQHYGDAEIFLDDVSLTDSGGGAWRYWVKLGLSWLWGPDRVPFQNRRASRF
jgi:hypothetical protein